LPVLTIVILVSGNLDPPSEPDASALYDRHFSVVPADTPELLDAVHALRYQVYCVEHPFEDPTQQSGGRERDRYDAQSVHAALIAKASGNLVGCVRLVLPERGAAPLALPIRELLSQMDRRRLDTFGRPRTAEISRYAIAKTYRRRQGESLYADLEWDGPSVNELRRLVPHMSLGLMRGVCLMAAQHGIENVCAAMSPPLLRLLERFGLVFDRLGPLIEYHGMRQPCVADGQQLLAGMAERHEEYYQLIAQTYRVTSTPQHAIP
jgi:N-acyl amino acid synthase of PEP-CTERM/exosortase system